MVTFHILKKVTFLESVIVGHLGNLSLDWEGKLFGNFFGSFREEFDRTVTVIVWWLTIIDDPTVTVIAWWLTIIDDPSVTDCMVTDHHWWPFCDWLHGDWPSLIYPTVTDCMVTDHHWWPYCDFDCMVTGYHWWPYCDWLHGDWPSLMTLLWLYDDWSSSLSLMWQWFLSPRQQSCEWI